MKFSIRKQRGMAMIISLIMLFILTIIIVHGARSSNLELLMGNNSQMSAQALMLAEDSTVTGESGIELNFPGAPVVDFSADSTDGVYLDTEIVVNTLDWDAFVTETTGAGATFREYIIEYIGPAPATGGSLALGAGAASDTRYIYRVSGRGEAAKGGARVVQTVYATAE